MDRRTEEELSEKKLYDEVYSFLSSYPEEATKAGKSVTRKCAKKFQVVDNVLCYKEVKGGAVQVHLQPLLNPCGFLNAGCSRESSEGKNPSSQP